MITRISQPISILLQHKSNALFTQLYIVTANPREALQHNTF